MKFFSSVALSILIVRLPCFTTVLRPFIATSLFENEYPYFLSYFTLSSSALLFLAASIISVAVLFSSNRDIFARTGSPPSRENICDTSDGFTSVCFESHCGNPFLNASRSCDIFIDEASTEMSDSLTEPNATCSDSASRTGDLYFATLDTLFKSNASTISETTPWSFALFELGSIPLAASAPSTYWESTLGALLCLDAAKAAE